MAAAIAAGNDFFLLLSLSSVKLASFFSFRERARLLALSVNSPLISLSLSLSVSRSLWTRALVFSLGPGRKERRRSGPQRLRAKG